jgi:hypothetical protein
MSRVSHKVFYICDFSTVSTVQHTYSSAARCIRLPLYTKRFYNDVLFLWYQNRGTAAERLARIKIHNFVWCKVFTVENCNGKKCRHIWDDDIKVDM